MGSRLTVPENLALFFTVLPTSGRTRQKRSARERDHTREERRTNAPTAAGKSDTGAIDVFETLGGDGEGVEVSLKRRQQARHRHH